MSIYQWLCLFSVPAIIVGAFKFFTNQIKGIKLGVQALLRAQMIAYYKMYFEWGSAPIYARDNFESCWKQYFSLGLNGVLHDLHIKFLQLPTSPEDDEHEIHT